MSLWERQQRSARAWAAELPRACAMCVGLVLSPWGRVVHGVCKAILQLGGRGVGALANPLLIAKSHRHVCGSLGTCGTPGCPKLGSWGVQGTGEHSPWWPCKLPGTETLLHVMLLHHTAAFQRWLSHAACPGLRRFASAAGEPGARGHGARPWRRNRSWFYVWASPRSPGRGGGTPGEGTPSPGDAAGATWPPPCAPRGS